MGRVGFGLDGMGDGGVANTGLRLINFGIAAEATVGKYVKIERLLREVKILYAFAYVFAASAASAAKCFRTEDWGPGPNPLRGSILLLKPLEQQKQKQTHLKCLPLSAASIFSHISPPWPPELFHN